MEENYTIGDLISAPDVKTVVHLRDLEDVDLGQTLAKHFVFTEEVCFIIRTILEKVHHDQGQGFFLMGNYGSGKSHLLFTLSLLFGYPQFRKHLLIHDESITSLVDDIGEKKYLLVTIPLQEHSNYESLEQVVLFHISRAMEARFNKKLPVGLPAEAIRLLKTTYRADYQQFLKQFGKSIATLEKEQEYFLAERFVTEKDLPIRSQYARHLLIPKLQDFIKKQACDGIVLLMDEISEFLRSKLQARTFQEDIRFLQYLGETSSQIPLWIVSSLQERIEETGEIPQQTFQKIKDRYPIRLYLSGQHIQELIYRFLIKKKPDHEHTINEIYQNLSHVFAKLPFDRELFVKLYPVHPATISYLEELKPLFSQHRGVVDFIHYNIVGDPSRHIEGHLDAPCDWLLSPDLIFDHFRLRIKETIEWNRYHDVVFHHFQEQSSQLFASTDEQKLALRIVKLLILSCLFPTPRSLSNEEITLLLLHRITDLDPQVNFQFVQAIVDRLVQEGVYIVRKKDPKTNVESYTIDIEYDIKVVVDRKIDAIRSEIFPSDQRLFTLLVSDMNEPFLPLSQHTVDELYPHEVVWLNSRRKGLLSLTSLTQEKPEWLKQVKQNLANRDHYFLFLILFPLEPDQEIEGVNQFLLPHLADHSSQILMWIPRQVTEISSLTDVLARRILFQRLEKDRNPVNEKMLTYLKGIVDQDRLVVKETLHTCYLNGELIDGNGQILYAVKDLGLLPFQQLLNRVLAEFFKQLFPKHNRIASLTDVYQRNRLDELIQKFFIPGQIDFQDYGHVVLKSIIDGYLKSMKLTKQIRKEIIFDCDPNRSEVVREALKLMKNQQLIRTEWENRIRNCEYGLSEPQTELLLLSLIFSGNITAFINNRKVEPHTINAKLVSKINRIGPGEIISTKHQDLLFQLHLLPEKIIFKGFFSIILQQEIWQWLIGFKEKTELEVENVKARFVSFQHDSLLAEIEVGKAFEVLSSVNKMIASICPSFDSRKGLLRFLDFVQNNPFITKQLDSFKSLVAFCGDEMNNWKKMLTYLDGVQKNRFLQLTDAPYEALKDLVNLLQRELRNISLIVDEDIRQSWIDSFQDFHLKYQELYLQEHTRYNSPAALNPLEVIVKSKHCKVLNMLTQLEFVQNNEASDTWLQKIQENRESLCTAAVEDIIQHKMWCDCGFQLGDTRQPINVDQTLQNLEQTIRQTLTTLKQSQVDEFVKPQLAGLTEIGKSENAYHIQKLLELKPDEPDLVNKLAVLLNADITSTLNKILKGKVRIKTRNIDEFLTRIKGKSLPAKRLIELFSEWLSLEDDDVYVRIEASKAPGEVTPSLRQDVFQQGSPFLTDLLEVFGEQQFVRLLLFLAWLKERSNPLERIYSLFPHFPSRDKNELSAVCDISETLLQKYPQLFVEHDEQIFYQEDAQSWLHRCLDALAPITVRELIKSEKMFPFLFQTGVNEIILNALRQEQKITDELIEELLQAPVLKLHDKLRKEIQDLQVMKQFLDLNQKLQLDVTDDPQSPRDWENIYKQNIAIFPYLEAQAKKILQTHGLTQYSASLMSEKTQKSINELNTRFEQFYAPSHQSIGLKLADFLKKKRTTLQKKYPDSRITYVLLDGMRYDLWTLVVQEIFQAEGTLTKPFENLILWATIPTTTAQQLKSVDIEHAMSFVTITNEEYAHQKLKEEIEFGGGTLCKINVIDSKIHTSHDPLPVLYQEILYQLNHQLVPIIRSLRTNDILAIFSDHGFIENPDFNESDVYQQPRYNHGGSSLFEVLVPAALFYKM